MVKKPPLSGYSYWALWQCSSLGQVNTSMFTQFSRGYKHIKRISVDSLHSEEPPAPQMSVRLWDNQFLIICGEQEIVTFFEGGHVLIDVQLAQKRKLSAVLYVREFLCWLRSEETQCSVASTSSHKQTLKSIGGAPKSMVL